MAPWTIRTIIRAEFFFIYKQLILRRQKNLSNIWGWGILRYATTLVQNMLDYAFFIFPSFFGLLCDIFKQLLSNFEPQIQEKSTQLLEVRPASGCLYKIVKRKSFELTADEFHTYQSMSTILTVQYTFFYKQPKSGLNFKSCLNFLRFLRSKLLEIPWILVNLTRKQWKKA